MKSFRLLTLACCCLATVVICQTFCCQAVFCQAAWGRAAPDQQPAQHKEKAPAVKELPPILELPAPKPKRLREPAQIFFPRAVAKPPAKRPAKVEKPPAGNQAKQPLRANRPLRPPFWSPRQSQLRQGNLSRASVYQLESMGRHVHLTPAMRWHLSRSGAAVTPPPAAKRSSATTAPGQGAAKFYPGVSRLPTQKPFANLERPATGLQRYWPLLLEGREDPNTGLIHWSLP